MRIWEMTMGGGKQETFQSVIQNFRHHYTFCKYILKGDKIRGLEEDIDRSVMSSVYD